MRRSEKLVGITDLSAHESNHGSETGVLRLEKVWQGESDGPSGHPEQSGTD
jgi:hypothetical protein